MQHIVKIFQRIDGSILFFISVRNGLPKDAVENMKKQIGTLYKEGDAAIIFPETEFQFFNISDSQLKEMEIKPEPPTKPK